MAHFIRGAMMWLIGGIALVAAPVLAAAVTDYSGNQGVSVAPKWLVDFGYRYLDAGGLRSNIGTGANAGRRFEDVPQSQFPDRSAV